MSLEHISYSLNRQGCLRPCWKRQSRAASGRAERQVAEPSGKWQSRAASGRSTSRRVALVPQSGLKKAERSGAENDAFSQPPYSLLHNEGPQPHPRPFSNHRRRTQLTPGASRPASEFLYGSQAFALRVRHGLSIGWRIEIALRIYTIVKTLGYGVKPQDHLSFYKRVWRTD